MKIFYGISAMFWGVIGMYEIAQNGELQLETLIWFMGFMILSEIKGDKR